MDKKEREGEPIIYKLFSDDPGMNDAIMQARNSLTVFDQAVMTNKFDSGTLALKVRFETANGGEHIWATQILIIDGIYYGKVDNVPDKEIRVELDEGLEIEKDFITDFNSRVLRFNAGANVCERNREAGRNSRD
jgi:uncharacterized protein YegJ (DUF2314 family)